MFGWFFGKKDVENIKEETKKGFESVKKDVVAVSGWIKHLHSEKEIHKKDLDVIKEGLSSVKEEIEEIKNVLSVFREVKLNSPRKKHKQVFNKQMPVYTVQTGVQTGVQTPKLEHFSLTERAIIWVLLNSDLKLSYDDLAAILGKEKSTIRGQINTIKQKSEDLIQEQIENNGKKRLFIEENEKEKMLKKAKVRVKKRDKKKEI